MLQADLSLPQVNLLFADSKMAIEAMDFGAAFYHQPKYIQALLVNNGPVAASFTVMPDEGDGDEPPEEVVTVHPAQGMLDPYETREVTFKFAPPLAAQLTGFLSQEDTEQPSEGVEYSIIKKIEVLESNQLITVETSAKAFRAQVPWPDATHVP